MLNQLATKLACHLFNRGMISAERMDIYVYGFELLLSFVFSTALIIIVGAVFHCILETITFLAGFILLRSFSGGYHALTYSFCTVVTLGIYGITISLGHYFHVNRIAFLLLFILGSIILSALAPIRNPNKELSKKKALQHKITSVVLLAIFCVLGTVLQVYSQTISSTMFYTLCADIVLLFPKNLRKGGHSDACDH